MLVNPRQSVYDQPYIDPSMVQAILTLHPSVPAGSPMVYDPIYGMGCRIRTAVVYFGQNTQDIAMKEKVYQSIVTQSPNRASNPL